jgi:two-component system aerobic respiration control sensor histidine kinase ArcB
VTQYLPETTPFNMPALDPRDAPTLALLGHDLRATLSEVIGGLRLIDPTPLPPQTRNQVARTRAASEALALLLEQALELLLGEPLQANTSASPLHTARLLQNIRLRWGARATELGHDFTLNTAADLPAQLPLDAAIVERVLSNLLGNALKYAGKGKITCNIETHTDRSLRIVVQDEGPGFSDATLARLWANYGRADSSTKPSSGLGLQIVRNMVEQVGGRISVSNRPQGGAEIIVQIPLPDEIPSPPTADIEVPDLSGLRILVADDSETSRLLLRTLLTQLGAEATVVADGSQAVGRIERETFDVLLIDIEMPQFNGLDVIRHIRAMQGPAAALPILAVTAYWLRDNKAAITAAGADAILSKPVQSAALLGQAVLQARQHHAVADPVTARQSTAKAADGLQQLLRMAGPTVAAQLLQQMHTDLRRVERGLLAASHGPNWHELCAQSHVLMALSGTAGAGRLHSLAQALNSLAQETAPDRGTYLSLLPEVLEALDTLIHQIASHSPTAGETR